MVGQIMKQKIEKWQNWFWHFFFNATTYPEKGNKIKSKRNIL
jgi:hypothetical protein